MVYATYNKIGGPRGHLAKLEEFKGNSMSGGRDIWVSGRFPGDTPWDIGTADYFVASYETLIAACWKTGRVWVTDRHFSRTTTHQQNLCRAWLGDAVAREMPVEVR